MSLRDRIPLPHHGNGAGPDRYRDAVPSPPRPTPERPSLAAFPTVAFPKTIVTTIVTTTMTTIVAMLVATLVATPGAPVGAEARPGSRPATPAPATPATPATPAPATPATQAPPSADELIADAERVADVVNFYRVGNGLPPVTVDPALNLDAWLHSCWMAANDQLDHYRVGASTGAAGEMSNIAVARSPLYPDDKFVDLWLSGPYHAVSMLRWGLQSIGYGSCTAPDGLWRKGSTMDVINGFQRRRTEAPVLFPPPDHTTDLAAFRREQPNPLENCGWDTAGLPVFAMLPEGPTRDATATLRGPDGEVETCLVTHFDDSTDGRNILRFDNAVLVIPAAPLVDGRWEVEIDSGRRQVAWGFWVGPERRAGPPDPPRTVDAVMPATAPVGAPGRLVTTEVTRTLDSRVIGEPPQLSPGTELRIPIGTPPPGATAVALTLTAASQREAGWAAVYPCEGGYNETSTVNFVPDVVAANSAIMPLMGPGAGPATGSGTTGAELCGRVSSPVDLIVDVSAWFVGGPAIGGSSADGAGFVPDAERVHDSRSPGMSGLRPGRTLAIEVAAPGAAAVAVNLTTTFTEDDGYLTAWPCDQERGETSVAQATVGLQRATAAIVPVAADGTICLYASSGTGIIVDRMGVFLPGEGAAFVPLLPVRFVDTRNGPHPWATESGRLRGRGEADAERPLPWNAPGLPADAVALSLNVTSVHGTDGAWVALAGCGRYAGQSTLNASFLVSATPNMAIVDAAAASSCLLVEGASHLLVDVSGAFVDP